MFGRIFLKIEDTFWKYLIMFNLLFYQNYRQVVYVALLSSLRGCRFNYSFVDKRVRGYPCTNFGYFYYSYFVKFIFFYLFILFNINIFKIVSILYEWAKVLKGGESVRPQTKPG